MSVLGTRLARARSWLAAVAAAFVLVVGAVGGAAANSGPTALSNPAVSARTVASGTSIAFAVTYINHEGSAPAYVDLVVDGALISMTGTLGATDWHDGVRYTVTRVLTVGRHTIGFAAADTRKFTAALAAGTVTIQAPPPAGGGSGGGTGGPTATPRPTPTPTPKPAPGSSQPPTAGSGGSASAGSGSGSSATAPGPSAPAAPPAGGGSTSTSGTGGSGPASDSTSGSDGPAGPPRPGLNALPPGMGAGLAGTTDPTSQAGLPGSPDQSGSGGGAPRSDPGAPGAASAVASPLAALFGGAAVTPETRLVVSVVTTGGAVSVAMAFMFFGKRRRDGEPNEPEEVLHASSARGGEPAADGVLVPETATPAVTPAVDAEMLMPRWRRPSLLEARKADPLRSATTVVNLSFETGAVGPVEGRERRRIRYRVVRLLDAPDELRATGIGFLDRGDEVQLLEPSGSYWSVLCPDGRQGWLHRMVLGDVVEDGVSDDEQSAEAGIDDDVLSAFRSSRLRAG